MTVLDAANSYAKTGKQLTTSPTGRQIAAVMAEMVRQRALWLSHVSKV